MSKVKIVMNREGMNEFLHSPGIKAALQEAAINVQSRAGSDYGIFPVDMPGRSIVRVSATNDTAMKDNSDNNTLLKSLH